MSRLTNTKRDELLALVMELQAGHKAHRVIQTILLEEHRLTEGQAKQLFREAAARWSSIAENDPGKGRHIEALGRIAQKAEASGNYNAAIKAYAEIAKVTGLYEAKEIHLTTEDDPERKRLEELIKKYES